MCGGVIVLNSLLSSSLIDALDCGTPRYKLNPVNIDDGEITVKTTRLATS